MNKKMKKVIALLTASVLCLGMSTTVFAAQSPIDPDINKSEDDFSTMYGTAKDKDGNRVTIVPSFEEVSKEVTEVLKDETKVKDILESAGYQPTEDQKVAVLGAVEFNVKGDMPEGGIDATLYLDQYTQDLTDLKDGDILYVLHQKADGTWEVLEGKAVVETETWGDFTYTTYGVNVHFDSLSPVAVIKITSNGKVVVLDKEAKKIAEIESDKQNGGNVQPVKTTTTAKTSPKTGN